MIKINIKRSSENSQKYQKSCNLINQLTPIKGTVNNIEVYELFLAVTPVTGLAASFGLVPTKSEFKKCDSIFFEKSESSGVPVTQPAGCGGKNLELKEIRKSASILVSDFLIL